MNLLEKTDQEILEIANPLWDDLVKHSNAKDYWNLADDAKLLDVIKVVRADEQNHADVNHGRADSLDKPNIFDAPNLALILDELSITIRSLESISADNHPGINPRVAGLENKITSITIISNRISNNINFFISTFRIELFSNLFI